MTMNPEHSPKTPRFFTALFPMFGGLFAAKGTGAPSHPHSLGGLQMKLRLSRSLAALLTLGVLAFAATPAFAKEVHVFTTSFGSEGSGAGQFKEPEGVAVNDETEDVYVVDKGNKRVEYFNSTGTKLEGEFNGAAAPTGALEHPTWIAVDNCTTGLGVRCSKLTEDPSVGDVYVAGEVKAGGTAHQAIYKFEADGTYLGQITGSCENAGEIPPLCSGFAEFTELEGVAVDPAGELWVSQASGKIENYSRALANEFLASRELASYCNGPCSADPGFAVGPEDDLYSSVLGGYNLYRFTSAGGYVSEPDGYGTQRTDVAVDLSNNEVYFDNVSSIYAYDALTETGVETFGEGHLGAGTGVAVNSSEGNALSNAVYVADGAGDRVDLFPEVDIPEVESVPASSVEVVGHEAVSVTLHGEVEPGGLPVTSCEFEYGTSTSYGKVAACEHPDAKEIRSGTGKVPVSVEVKGLLPDTTYHFRLIAANKNDEHERSIQIIGAGADESFSTPGPSVGGESAADVTATTATLSGEVNPGELLLGECRFEYGPSSEYYAQSAPCEPDAQELGSGTAPIPVHAQLEHLLGGTTYHFRLVVVTTEGLLAHEAKTVAGTGQEFPTSTVPVVADGEAKNVTASGAELTATVNPEGLQVTRCKFEYGTSTAYGSKARCEPKLEEIGHGSEPVPVSARITGLHPNTTYHWRLHVEDKNGEAFASGHTFVYPTTASELPDHRAYELVTPVHKNGALFGDDFYDVPTGVAEGPEGLHPGPSRVIGWSIQCVPGTESCTGERGSTGEPYAFTRAATGWQTTALAPPATQYSANSAWLWSADEGTALFSLPTGPAGEDEWYSRSSAGAFSAIGPSTPTPLPQDPVNPYQLNVKTGTADLSHVVWETDPSQGGDWPFDQTAAKGGRSLYEYAGVREGTHNEVPLLVGVTGTSGSTELISDCATTLGGDHGTSPNHWNATSADGRTVYFTAYPPVGGETCTAPPVNELYARVDGEQADAHTAAISEPQALVPGVRAECGSAECEQNTSVANQSTDWRNATFLGASEDGSDAVFASEQQLTDGATQGSENLYLSECTSECEQGGEQRTLIDLSAPEQSGEGGGGPRVQGLTAISADGSHVYFVAQGVLTSEERPGCKREFEAAGASEEEGCHAKSGADNLYLYAEGHVAFVARLAADDAATVNHQDWDLEEEVETPNVTPDGRFLVFVSHGDLTPGTHSGGTNQVFRYDAQTEDLIRVSIGQDGFDDDGNAGARSGLGTTIVPAGFGGAQLGPARGDPTMANDGARIFFQSSAALTPHALNGEVDGAQNVYEWEQEGVGSCPSGQSAGCIYLISDGHDTSSARDGCEDVTDITSAVCLVGVDATGDNVYFTTADQLVPSDTDTQVDVYDARICEPEHGNPCVTEPPPTFPCIGEQCHGIPEPTPSLLAPGTASFNGEGNVASSAPYSSPKTTTKKTTKCKRGFTKKKNKCVRSKKRAKKSSKSKRGGKS